MVGLVDVKPRFSFKEGHKHLREFFFTQQIVVEHFYAIGTDL